MPYYASAGEAFWSGANKGAQMASKWVDAYDWGNKYQNNEAFKKDAKTAIDTYNEGMKGLDSISDASAREKQRQALLTARNEQINASAAEHFGDKGAQIGNQYITNFEAGDKNVTNSSERMHNRDVFAINPDKYLYRSMPRMGFSSKSGVYGNGTSFANAAGMTDAMIGAYMKSAAAGNDEDIVQSLSPFGLSSSNGGLFFGNDPANMPQLMGRMQNLFGFTGTTFDWQ